MQGEIDSDVETTSREGGRGTGRPEGRPVSSPIRWQTQSKFICVGSVYSSSASVGQQKNGLAGSPTNSKPSPTTFT